MLRTLREIQFGSLRSLFLRLLLELVIVFLGVYFAFLFNKYKLNRELEGNQIQLLNALNKEIDYFLEGAKRREPVMQQTFEQWQKSVEAGEKKAPLYFVMEGTALPTKSMWQVVISFNGINLLDVPTMFELSKYYNSFDIMLTKYQKLIDFAETEIIPFENDPDYFYLSGIQLKQKYEAYINRYDDFNIIFQKMIEESESLKSQLQSEIENLK